MTEPLDMSKARNAYAKVREQFRKEMLWTLKNYDGRPITFDIKQHLRFRAADQKQACLENYRAETRNIKNNQAALVGSNLRLRSMVTTEEANSDIRAKTNPASFNETRRRRPAELDLTYDEEDFDTFLKNRGSLATRSAREEVSTPISRLTFDSHRNATTNTHVLSFERQLIEDIDRMIRSIEGLDDTNRATWLQIPKSDSSQYFASRYDNTGFSLLPINTNTNLGQSSSIATNYLPTVPGSENSFKTNDVINRTSSEQFYNAFAKYSSLHQ